MEQVVDSAIAVAKGVEPHPDAIKQGQVQVREWRAFVEPYVPASSHAAGCSPGDEDR